VLKRDSAAATLKRAQAAWRAEEVSATVAFKEHMRIPWDFERGSKGHESAKPLRFRSQDQERKGRKQANKLSRAHAKNTQEFRAITRAMVPGLKGL
jgi:hypothetical protein